MQTLADVLSTSPLSEQWDKGLPHWTSAFEFLCSGQFTLWTRLIHPNFHYFCNVYPFHFEMGILYKFVQGLQIKFRPFLGSKKRELTNPVASSESWALGHHAMLSGKKQYIATLNESMENQKWIPLNGCKGASPPFDKGGPMLVVQGGPWLSGLLWVLKGQELQGGSRRARTLQNLKGVLEAYCPLPPPKKKGKRKYEWYI